ncbi:4-hydroxy-tetrahydrodipicolinate synthase [Candidatus Woesearchaeota archaeon]|nr:4-hydroxy-tetrahydrodipicolinate synthase [Candidatus Woesearchaeota archaeon]
MHGVYTALITPFDSDGKPDLAGLRKNIRFQIEEGVDGIVPLGTTGETPTLSDTEQEAVIRVAVAEAHGKINVMVGTGSNSTAKTIEYTQRAKALGADAALIVTPYYNKPTQEGIYQHFKAITEAVDLPILVYNIQGRSGVNIHTVTLKRIAGLRNIIGVKEASGNVEQMMEVIQQIQHQYPHFCVMSGDDGLTLPLLSLGGKGVVSVASNLVPGEVVGMVKAALAGDFAQARKKHFELLPLFKAIFVETNPIPVKESMSMVGMPSGSCRLPLCALMPENRAKLQHVLQEMHLV